jgi:hypothetical protein
VLGRVLVSAPTVVPLPWQSSGAAPVGLDSGFWSRGGAVSLSHAHLTAKVLSSKRALQLEPVSMV